MVELGNIEEQPCANLPGLGSGIPLYANPPELPHEIPNLPPGFSGAGLRPPGVDPLLPNMDPGFSTAIPRPVYPQPPHVEPGFTGMPPDTMPRSAMNNARPPELQEPGIYERDADEEDKKSTLTFLLVELQMLQQFHALLMDPVTRARVIAGFRMADPKMADAIERQPEQFAQTIAQDINTKLQILSLLPEQRALVHKVCLNSHSFSLYHVKQAKKLLCKHSGHSNGTKLLHAHT